MTILLKVADISNECRPKEVAELWLDCLLKEYFLQVFGLAILLMYRMYIYVCVYIYRVAKKKVEPKLNFI